MTRAGDVRLASDWRGCGGVLSSRARVRAGSGRRGAALCDALALLVDAVALFMDNTAEEVRDAIGKDADAAAVPRRRGRRILPWVRRAVGQGHRHGRWHTRVRPQHCRCVIRARPGSCSTAMRPDPRCHRPGVRLVPAAHGTQQARDTGWGMTPDNVFDAILTTLPWGVDVSSGIESAPGIKDGDLMRHFVEEVRRADCHVEHAPLDAGPHPGLALRAGAAFRYTARPSRRACVDGSLFTSGFPGLSPRIRALWPLWRPLRRRNADRAAGGIRLPRMTRRAPIPLSSMSSSAIWRITSVARVRSTSPSGRAGGSRCARPAQARRPQSHRRAQDQQHHRPGAARLAHGQDPDHCRATGAGQHGVASATVAARLGLNASSTWALRHRAPEDQRLPDEACSARPWCR